MVIGSGLMARAFAHVFDNEPGGLLVYAAGVSNSGCGDPREFQRERDRLSEAMSDAQTNRAFIYFSTCSVEDPEAVATPYVQHKIAMEGLVRTHPGHLIIRLPQVAGRTPNPHTLLNYLYARISRGERFAIWNRARRNIIDVDDVVRIVKFLVRGSRDCRPACAETIAVANAGDYGLGEIVAAFERVTGKRALFDVLAKGGTYHVDISRIRPLLASADVLFDNNYLDRTLLKYYGATT